MRSYELLLVVINVPVLAWCLSGRVLPAWLRIVPAVALVVLVLHGVLEGARWHMGPGYVVVACLFLACCWPAGLQPGRWGAVVGLGLLTGAAAVGTVLPVFDLPAPTGPHPIGTVTLHLVDSSRAETQGNHPGGPRELMVQVWYPAEKSGPGQVYRARSETELKKSHLALVRTHAAVGVSVSRDRNRYPVILFSPSWTGRRDQNTVQVEELASHGFIVVGVDHPYGTALTVFPDGRRVETVLGEWMDFATDESFQRCLRRADAEVRIRAADMRFVLDAMERLDKSDPAGLFTGRMDSSRVGVFGHSFGGAVSAEVCATDQRFKAGANLDGTLFGKVRTTTIGKPFLVFFDDTPAPTRGEVDAATGRQKRELGLMAEEDACVRRRLTESGGYLLTVQGAGHMNFCDSPLYSPMRRLTHCGPIPAKRGMQLINECLLAFFEAKLNGGREAELASAASAYPEVHVERFPEPGHNKETR